MNTEEHPLSWQAIGRVIVAGLALMAIWKLFDVFVLLLVATMLAAALNPAVMRLNKRLPLVASSLLVMLVLLVPFAILIATLVPNLSREIPGLLESIDRILNGSNLLPTVDLTKYAENAGRYALQSTGTITNVLTSSITLFFLTFYLLLDGKRLAKLMLAILPKKEQQHIGRLSTNLAEITGQYIRGNLIISVICGVCIYVGLLILNIPFAGPLAIFAGLMDLLPLVGSIIAVIPAILMGLIISPLTALLVAAVYLVYQQIENAFIAPAIYNKALNLSPALSFVSVIVGASLLGIVGAFIALPIAASLPAIIKYVREDSDLF